MLRDMTTHDTTGLRLVAEHTELSAGRPSAFRFRVLDGRERPVTDFEVEHERPLHVIAVRRDLRHYRHVHPWLTDGGTWEVALELPEPGVYRVFADFNRSGDSHTLGIDVSVPGRLEPQALSGPAEKATAPGGEATEGREAMFTREAGEVGDGHGH